MELRATKAGEADFGNDTRRYPIDVYTADVPRATIYISGNGAVSVVPTK